MEWLNPVHHLAVHALGSRSRSAACFRLRAVCCLVGHRRRDVQQRQGALPQLPVHARGGAQRAVGRHVRAGAGADTEVRVQRLRLHMAQRLAHLPPPPHTHTQGGGSGGADHGSLI